MKTIVQRVCWNTRGWRLPAGSTDEKGFPGEKGFGHEEWNFQLEDAVDGWLYGYTYTRPSISQGEPFRLYFYAIHPTTKDRLLVGCYKHARLINDPEYKKLLQRFRSAGILERRAQELQRVVPHMSRAAAFKEVESSLKESWLKVKCPVESVQLVEPPCKLPLKVGERTLSHRFRTFTYVEESELFANLPQESEQRDRILRVDLAEDGYFRESRENLREIIPRHNALSNSFCRWLEARGVAPKQEQQDVDVEFYHVGQSYRVELKVTYAAGIRHSLREAIGQLLEYNLYPGREMHDNWIVVLDCKPDLQSIEYIAALREEFGLPLHLGWQSSKAFHFCDPRPSNF